MSQSKGRDVLMADDEPGSNPASNLVQEIGRAAQAGWGPTARMCVQLAVIAITAAVIMLIFVTSR